MLFNSPLLKEKPMQHILKSIALFVLLSGCGSTPIQPAQDSLSPNTTFSSVEIDLSLTQKQAVDGYPNQEQLTAIIKEKSLSKFDEVKLISAASNYSAKISVKYQRRFAGEDTPIPSKSVMAPIVSYTIVIFNNGIEKQRVEKAGLTTNKGFASNLKTTFTLGLGKTAKDEEQDYEMLANTFKTELLSLRN
jgi:hypothetical protein